MLMPTRKGQGKGLIMMQEKEPFRQLGSLKAPDFAGDTNQEKKPSSGFLSVSQSSSKRQNFPVLYLHISSPQVSS